MLKTMSFGRYWYRYSFVLLIVMWSDSLRSFCENVDNGLRSTNQVLPLPVEFENHSTSVESDGASLSFFEAISLMFSFYFDTDIAPNSTTTDTSIHQVKTENITVYEQKYPSIESSRNLSVSNISESKSRSSLYCYVCNSHYQPECSDPFKNSSRISALLHQCPALSNSSLAAGMRSLCRKIVQHLSHDRRVLRYCGETSAEERLASVPYDGSNCYTKQSIDEEEVACACFDSACNAASSVVFGRSAFLWEAPPSIVLYMFLVILLSGIVE